MFVAYAGNTMRNARPFVDDERERQEREVAEYEARLAEMRADNLRKLAEMRAEADAAIAAANAALRKLNASVYEAHRIRLTNAQVRRVVRAPDGLDRILRRISKATGITVHEIRGERRSASVAFARHAFCYWAVRRTVRSLPEIGRFLGSRDHTTIMHGRDAYVVKRAAMGRTLRRVK